MTVGVIDNLRVLFDAYELAPGAGKSMGIYNYARNLLPALARASVGTVEFVVACNSACEEDFKTASPNVKLRVLHNGVPGKISRQIWWRVRAAVETLKANADVYLSPKGFLPNAIQVLSPRTRTVVVVHDLIPLWYRDHYPGYFGAIEEFIVNAALTHSVRHADSVIAISRSTADDIRTRLGRVEGVSVVHNGVPIATPGSPVIPGPFILAVTSRLPHKNAVGVLEAYARYRAIAEHPLPMVLCGFDAGKCEGVHSVSALSDSELHACYANAVVCLFLPRIEGFGFPPVEAMAHGTPVVCSDIPSLREVTRGAAVYVPLDDPDRAAEAIERVVSGPRLDPRELSAAVAGYDWDTCARGILSQLVSREPQ